MNELHQARLSAIASMRDEVVAAGDEAQVLRRLPHGIAKRLVDEGFFRFTLPKALGGEDASSMETIEVIEDLAAIDASVAWNVMIGSETAAMAAGGMEPAVAKEVFFDNPRVVMCGGGGPGTTPARAERQADGGVKVWGRTTFTSACDIADYAFMPAALSKNGAPELDAAGKPIFKFWMLPRSQWEILRTWDMSGLRGSGSDDVLAQGAYVDPKHVDVDLWALPSHYENPVFRIPIPLRLAFNKAALALGIAKGALETFADIAQNKIPKLTSKTLAHRPIAQHRVGEVEARYKAARAFLMQSMRDVEEELLRGAELPSGATTQNARLACVHAANECMHVVDVLHNTAGTTGLRMDSPLERKLRDAHGCASHRWVSHALYQDLGKITLGHEPPGEFAGGMASAYSMKK